MTIKESLDVLAGWIEERTREKRYPKSELKELSKALLNIRDIAEDQLTCHKWPEEKPEWADDYLVNLPGRKNGERVVMYYSVEWCEWGFRDGNTLITSTHEPDHWWNLPEVTE